MTMAVLVMAVIAMAILIIVAMAIIVVMHEMRACLESSGDGGEGVAGVVVGILNVADGA